MAFRKVTSAPLNIFNRRPFGDIVKSMKETPYLKLFINNPLVVIPTIIAVGIYIKEKKVSEILGVTGWMIVLLIPILYASFKFGKQVSYVQINGWSSNLYSWSNLLGMVKSERETALPL